MRRISSRECFFDGLRKAASRIIGLILVIFPLSASAAQHLIEIAIDTDTNVTTGCSMDFGAPGSEDQQSGFEWRVRLRVDPNTPQAFVQSSELVPCDSGSWDATASTTIDQTGWNVGLNIGESGSDVVEGYVPMNSLGDPQISAYGPQSSLENPRLPL